MTSVTGRSTTSTPLNTQGLTFTDCKSITTSTTLEGKKLALGLVLSLGLGSGLGLGVGLGLCKDLGLGLG